VEQLSVSWEFVLIATAIRMQLNKLLQKNVLKQLSQCFLTGKVVHPVYNHVVITSALSTNVIRGRFQRKTSICRGNVKSLVRKIQA
jgi:hypothetical protein